MSVKSAESDNNLMIDSCMTSIKSLRNVSSFKSYFCGGYWIFCLCLSSVCSLHPRFYFSLRDSSHLRADTKGNERHVFGQSQQHSNQSWNEIRGVRQFQKPTPTKAPMIGKCHRHQGLIYPWPIVWEKLCLDLEQCTLGKMTMYINVWHINEIYWSFPIYSCVAIY